jgi:hypothetical protein
MKAASGPGADYEEMKEEILENLEELEDVGSLIEDFKSNFEACKKNKEQLDVKSAKVPTIEGLQKTLELLVANKNTMT